MSEGGDFFQPKTYLGDWSGKSGDELWVSVGDATKAPADQVSSGSPGEEFRDPELSESHE